MTIDIIKNQQSLSLKNKNELFSVYDNYDMFNSIDSVKNHYQQINILEDSLIKYNKGDNKKIKIEVYEKFKKKFKIFTQNQLNSLDWANTLIVGDTILWTIMDRSLRSNTESSKAIDYAVKTEVFDEDKKNDQDNKKYIDEIRKYYEKKCKRMTIDIYYYNITKDEMHKKIMELYNQIIELVPFNVEIRKTEENILIYSKYPFRTIKISKKIYKSKYDIISSEKIDCLSLGYDGTRIWMSMRCYISIMTNKNEVENINDKIIEKLPYYGENFNVNIKGLKLKKINTLNYNENETNLSMLLLSRIKKKERIKYINFISYHLGKKITINYERKFNNNEKIDNYYLDEELLNFQMSIINENKIIIDKDDIKLIDRIGINGYNILHLCVIYNKKEILQKLLNHSKNITMKAINQKNIFDLACEYNNTDIINSIIEHNEKNYISFEYNGNNEILPIYMTIIFNNILAFSHILYEKNNIEINRVAEMCCILDRNEMLEILIKEDNERMINYEKILILSIIYKKIIIIKNLLNKKLIKPLGYFLYDNEIISPMKKIIEIFDDEKLTRKIFILLLNYGFKVIIDNDNKNLYIEQPIVKSIISPNIWIIANILKHDITLVEKKFNYIDNVINQESLINDKSNILDQNNTEINNYNILDLTNHLINLENNKLEDCYNSDIQDKIIELNKIKKIILSLKNKKSIEIKNLDMEREAILKKIFEDNIKENRKTLRLKNEYSIIHELIKSKNNEELEILLKKSKQKNNTVNKLDYDEILLLKTKNGGIISYAIDNDSEKSIEIILKNIDEKILMKILQEEINNNRNKILDWCIEKNNIKIFIKIMELEHITKHTNVEKKSEYLFKAAKFGNIRLIILLTKYMKKCNPSYENINIMSIDEKGDNIIHYMCSDIIKENDTDKYLECIEAIYIISPEIFIKKNKKSILFESVKTKNILIFQKILSLTGVNWNDIDDDGYNIIHIIAMFGNKEMLDNILRLSKNGIIDNNTNKYKMNALSLSIINRNKEVAEHLINRGANLYIEDIIGNRAEHYKSIRYIDDLKMEYKNIENNFGRTGYEYLLADVTKLILQGQKRNDIFEKDYIIELKKKCEYLCMLNKKDKNRVMIKLDKINAMYENILKNKNYMDYLEKIQN